MRILPLVLAVGLLSACQQLPHSHTQSAAQPTKTAASPTQHSVFDTRLKNGLRVLIKPDHRAPIVMTQIWYDVGSIDEPIGKGGMSHFLEHLMFKDSKGISHDDSQRLISHFGGKINAFTSYDYTAYYESLPANQYPLALQIEANRMQNLLFNTAEVATEKQVVQEERRLRTDDKPLSKAYEIFVKHALPHSPKGLPVIGSMADIEGISLEDLQNWYRQWYAPNNATLVIVGDVKPEEAMVWVHKYFDNLSSMPLPTRKPLNHPTHQGYQQHSTQQAVQVPSLLMGFNVPSLKNAANATDAYALMLLSDIADGGLSARFESSLIRKKNLLNSVSVSYDLLAKGDELFTISATPRAGVSLQAAEQAILDELTAIYQGNISDDELQRGRTNLSASLVFDNDSVANQAISLGSLASIGLPIDTLEKLPNKLASISKKDIQATGKKYLNKDNLTTLYIYPNDK